MLAQKAQPWLEKKISISVQNKALEEVDVLAKEELKKSTEGIIPNIPGLDLGNLGG